MLIPSDKRILLVFKSRALFATPVQSLLALINPIADLQIERESELRRDY